MRSTSVDELHLHTSELMREVEKGGVIVIEREGSPIAELRPVVSQTGAPQAVRDRIFAEMADVWARLPYTGDSTLLVEEDRAR